MGNIKNFEQFNKLNEELLPSTYLSAADKLKGKGHKKRAEELEKFGKDKSKSKLDGVKPITVTIDGVEWSAEPGYFKVDVTKNHGKEHGQILIEWNLISEDGIEEYQCLEFAYDSKENVVLDSEFMGLLVDNRKDANTIVKLIKNVIDAKVDEYPELELVLPFIKANDLYRQ